MYTSDGRRWLRIWDYKVVGPNAVLAASYSGLCLLCLDHDNRRFFRIQWERRDSLFDSTCVITAITGSGVEISRAVFNDPLHERIEFYRVDVDALRVECEWEEFACPCRSYQFDSRGQLYGFSGRYYDRLHTYDLKRRVWSGKNVANRFEERVIEATLL